MDPVLLSSTHTPQLLQKLGTFGDLSLQVRNILLLDKRCPSEQFQVWVDIWPEFTTVLLKQKLSESHYHNYYVFSLVKENLKELLQNTDIIEWENATFRFCLADFIQIIDDIADKRGFRVRRSGVCFLLYKLNIDQLKQRTVPKDITVGSLLPDMADRVLQNMKLSGYQEKRLFHIRYLLENYPSVCLYDMNGTPFAYEVLQEFGGLGMLFVEPNYRKQGFAKLVSTLLLQMSAVDGFQPFVFVNIKNISSQKLHDSLGFEKIDLSFDWVQILPK